MKRLLPAPMLSASLLALWLVLNQSMSFGHVLLALVLAVAMPLLFAPLRPLQVRIRRPLVVIRLILTVGMDVLLSNLEVGWGVLRPGRHPPNGAFVRIPLDLHDASGLAALSTITTVVPGTVWSELARDRSALLLHVWDLRDKDEFVAHFKSRYEKPLMEIFQ